MLKNSIVKAFMYFMYFWNWISKIPLQLLCQNRSERASQPEPWAVSRWRPGEQSDSTRPPGHTKIGAAGGDELSRVGGQDEGPGFGAGAAEGEEAGGPHQESLLQSQDAEAGRGLARVVSQQQQRRRGEDAATNEMSWRVQRVFTPVHISLIPVTMRELCEHL